MLKTLLSIDLHWSEDMSEYGSNDIVVAAQRLYKLGLNVFPIPGPREVLAWAADKHKNKSGKKYERDANSKPPYFINVLFNNRLHVCDETCAETFKKTGKGCYSRNERFENLFGDSIDGYKSNIAVMLGRMSGNLMVIDCDSHEAFEKNLAIVQQKNIPHWAYTSFRGGGILVRVLEGEAKTMEKCLEKDVEIYGHHHYAVLPPSLHPKGVYYTWLNIDPTADENQMTLEPVSYKKLAWLGVKLFHENGKMDGATQIADKVDIAGYPTWLSKLSNTNKDFVVNGAKISERNKRLFSAACDMAGNEINQDEAESLLLDACSKCNPIYPVEEAMRSIESAYSAPRQPAQSTNSMNQWQKAMEFAQKFDWTKMGRTRETDQAVFMASIERAKMDMNNSRTFRGTAREIAVLSNRTLETTLIALHRISNREEKDIANDIPSLLVLDHYDKSNRASYYRFSDVVINCAISEQHFTLENHVRILYIPNPSTPAEQDVCKKLGTIGWKIWNYLLANPRQTTREIAIGLNIPGYSVRRYLQEIKPLVNFDFVSYEKIGKTYIANPFTQETLAQLAIELKTSGKSEKIRIRFRREREMWANHKIGKARRFWLNRRHYWEQIQNGDLSQRDLSQELSEGEKIGSETSANYQHPFFAQANLFARLSSKQKNEQPIKPQTQLPKPPSYFWRKNPAFLRRRMD